MIGDGAGLSESGAADTSPFDSPASGDGAHWIIVVARDQPDLLAHLAQAFSDDDKVEIIMDRRKDYSRNPPDMEARLRIRGAAVVRRPDP